LIAVNRSPIVERRAGRSPLPGVTKRIDPDQLAKAMNGQYCGQYRLTRCTDACESMRIAFG
jgi:hypothetical protein